MSDHDERKGVGRRQVLECMTWAGTGVLWTIAGGVPRSLGLVDQALAAEPAGLTFLRARTSQVEKKGSEQSATHELRHPAPHPRSPLLEPPGRRLQPHSGEGAAFGSSRDG